MLALRALGLGDLLTGVPALRALVGAFPRHETVLAAPATLAPLVGLALPEVTLLDTAPLRPVPWSGPVPAVAVDLHGRGPESHRLLQRLRPGRLVAFGCPAAGHRGPAWRPGEHEVDRWCRLLRETLALPADPGDLRIPSPTAPAPVAGAVLVHPGAAAEARRWPAERYAAVARALTAAGHRVLVTGGPDEAALAGRVGVLAGLPAAAVWGGRTDLPTLAALVAAARLVVCGDTGVAHLATALGTPSVVLFGPVAPSAWGPPPGGPHAVLWHGDGSGDPHATRPDPALLRNTVEEVLAAARRLLAGAAPAPHHG